VRQLNAKDTIMKIRELMIPNPITISSKASISDAIECMKLNAIRHLPVVQADNKLEGFVTLADLKQGLIPSMVSDLSLTDLMIKNPITVHPDEDIELAAQLIYHHKIGGMPVVQAEQVVGILTESDILRTFIDMMGLLSASSRIDVVVGDRSDALQGALRIIQEHGGNIMNVATTSQPGNKKLYYVRLSPCDITPIRQALARAGFEVVDAVG
jgi:acetoin utilization protein AcuB